MDSQRQIRAIVYGFVNKYSRIRVENACRRALYYKSVSYISIKNILSKGFDKEPLEEPDYAVEGQSDFRFARSPQYYKV